MHSEVRQLPIATNHNTDPPLNFAQRIWHLLTPDTRMKRWTYAGLVMAALNDVNVLFSILAVPMLTVSALYYAWRTAVLIKERLLWKVRNRILASFVFVGIVPLCLATLIGIIIGWFLIGAMGTILTLRQFEHTISRLDHLPQDIQLALYRTGGDKPLPFAEAVNTVMQANQDMESLSIGIFEQRSAGTVRLYAGPADRVPDVLPTWHINQPFVGLVVDSMATAEFRTVSDVTVNDRRFLVFTSMPVDPVYQTKMWEKSGVRLTSVVFTKDIRDRQQTAWTQLPWNLGDFRLPWRVPFKTTKWANNKEDTLFISVALDPVRIIRDALSVDIGFVQLVLGALISLCTILAGVELVSFLIGLFISRRITSAVHSLSRATQAIRSGNLDYRIETHKNDQLGELTRSFNDMARSIKVLLNEVREKHRIQAELEMAREVQARFLPKNPPTNGRLELAAIWMPARMVSGDYYDFIVHDGRALDIVVSDISGKGMSAALMMAGLQSALRAQSMIDGLEMRPGRIVRLVDRLNQHLCLNSAPDKFATLFICSYDIHTSLLTYCCAGHNPPYLYSNGTRTQLMTGGCPIGMFSDWTYEEDTIGIDTDDLFVIYTDGITEAQNREQKEFGEDRLERVIHDNRNRSCEEIQKRILAAVRDFSHGAEQFDDQTVVVGRVR